MSGLWGEIQIPEVESSISSVEIEQMLKIKPVDVEAPLLHQPSRIHFPPTTEPHKPEAFQLDNIALHTVRLTQHARRLRALIHAANLQLQELKNTDKADRPSFTPAPPIPEYTGRSLKYQEEPNKALRFLPQNADSDFVRGIWKSPPEIDHRTNRRLMRKSVAAVTAHAGYDNCGESVLETLTDISHEYMLQMTRLLRRAVDNERQNGLSGFPDPLEQVFHEMGLGSMTNLHEFYQKRVIEYHENVRKTCADLIAEYERVTHPDAKLQEDIKPFRVKEEPLSDIHFPTTEESEEGTDNEQILQLEGLGLEMQMTQESSGSLSQEEESKWQHTTKVEPTEKYSGFDSYDHDDANSSASEIAKTPAHSEGGDSVKDPGSVPMAEMMSPLSVPGITIRTPTGKPPKKKKKK